MNQLRELWRTFHQKAKGWDTSVVVAVLIWIVLLIMLVLLLVLAAYGSLAKGLPDPDSPHEFPRGSPSSC